VRNQTLVAPAPKSHERPLKNPTEAPRFGWKLKSPHPR
jgi:hypothetical protein